MKELIKDEWLDEMITEDDKEDVRDVCSRTFDILVECGLATGQAAHCIENIVSVMRNNYGD